MNAEQYLNNQLSSRMLYNSCIDDITEVVAEIMDDFSNHQTAPLHQRIVELEAEIEYLKYKKSNIADMLKGYVKHSVTKREALEALNAKYKEALERIRDWQYNPETTVYQLAEQALNHNLKDNG